MIRWLLAAVTLLGSVACTASTNSSETVPPGVAHPPATFATLADLAFHLAAFDGQPPRKSVYLSPLRRIDRNCRHSSISAIGFAVDQLAGGISATHLVDAPNAAAEAVLAADLRRGEDCIHLGYQIAKELRSPGGSPGHEWTGQTMDLQLSPPLTATLALASIRNVVLPGPERIGYALTAADCQQAVYFGPKLAALTGSPDLGAFVELSSGGGVGHTRYDARQVDRARITTLGRIGGQSCT